jgi:hypothetical protein
MRRRGDRSARGRAIGRHYEDDDGQDHAIALSNHAVGRPKKRGRDSNHTTRIATAVRVAVIHVENNNDGVH